ncbi:MAG: TrkA C-terminal domain-containing protein [Chloroflexota bacterium]
MIAILQSNSLLLLFLVAALGYAIGQVRLLGSRMGVAAVLFVGLAFGALDPSLQIPDPFLNLGLVLFVYTIGLSNGAGFFATFRGKGGRDALFVVAIMALPALLLLAVFFFLPLTPAHMAGIFAGTSTNTAALAGVLDYINNSLPAAAAEPGIAQTVVGFSIVYPLGVLGRMVAISLMQRWWQIDYAAEADRLRDQYPIGQELGYCTIEITQPAVVGTPFRRLRRDQEWQAIVFGRIYRQGQASLIDGSTQFRRGDRIVIAGTKGQMREVTAVLGQTAPEDLLEDSETYLSRRLFLSNPDLVGQPLAALNLKEEYGALISHVRRGDIELLAGDNTVLELGDRVRVLARREEMPALVALFGDSYAAISQVDLLTTGLGITLGLLLGMIPIPLPGGLSFQLGLAGGPLLVALLLGALRRTGPIVWNMPYSANMTLRQFGLICLLATIGVRSGNGLVEAFASGAGWLIVGVGTAVTLISALIALYAGYKLLRIPYSILIGMISPQPALLGYALEQANNPLPNVGYTLMFPISIIVNVILAQVLLILLLHL